MKLTLYNLSAALLFIYLTIAVSTARSFQKKSQSLGDQSNNHHVFQYNSQTISSSNTHSDPAAASFLRSKRSVDECPVHPDTPVILNGKQTFFDFSVTQAAPTDQQGDIEDIPCPAQFGDWWPGVTSNLAASCPWTWITRDTWTITGFEVYPRYFTEAKCLCTSCVNAVTMGCQPLKREFQFYKKDGCQGNKPVFEGGKLNVTVGCYCSKL